MPTSNNPCCCTCEELFANVNPSENPFVKITAVGRFFEEDGTIIGTLEEVNEHTIRVSIPGIFPEQATICCAHIIAVQELDELPNGGLVATSQQMWSKK